MNNDASIHYKIKEFSRVTVKFTRFKHALDRVLEIKKTYEATSLPQNLLIVGESGCGKSTLCQAVVEKYPSSMEPDRNIVPVLWKKIPALATINSVAEELLIGLRDPAPALGTVSNKTARLIKLIRGCRVQMLMIDEMQHVSDRGTSPTIYKVADWLKVLADESGKNVVLVGLPRTRNLFVENEQLRRRFSTGLQLSKLSLDDEQDTIEFASLLQALDNALPLELRSGLAEKNFIERLHYASDGRIGYLMALLIRALTLALQEKRKTLDNDILDRAYKSQIWNVQSEKLNPFSKEFCFRRLDKLGEPFHESDAYMRNAR